MIRRSPRLALALAEDVRFNPYTFLITNTFATTGSPAALTGTQPSKPITTDLLIEAIDVEIQTPNAFVGDEFKPLSDANYNMTSGIQTRITVEGQAKWAASYFPLRALPLLATETSPWTLLEEQALTLDFNVTTALPTGYSAIVINVTFACKVPSQTAVYRHSQKEACAELDAMGYDTRYARRAFGLSPGTPIPTQAIPGGGC